MREIKFRGLREDNERWIYGFYLHSNLHKHCILSDFTLFTIKDGTQSQFTGLTDKNDKEIYEGDIVKWDDNSNGEYHRICKIIWNKSRYELHGYTQYKNKNIPCVFVFGSFIYEQDGILEVIGNVFENPELLNTK